MFWPERILGPRPGLREVNFACWALFLAFLVVPLGIVHWIQAKQGVGSYTQLHSDFVLYYGTGTLANQYPATKIYDYALQQRAFNEISPDLPYGTSPYPPFIPLFFSFLARLSFNNAYFVWLVLTLALYCAGIWAVASVVFPGERLTLSLILCFALAYQPFVAETLANGQLSAIAIFAFGLAIYQEMHERSFYGGLALALLTYKPTLLLLVLPMLFLTRRLRMLFGFIAGGLALFLVGTAYGGLKVWPAYVGLLRLNSRLAGVHGQSALKLEKYLDFSSVSHMIPGGRTTAGLIFLFALAIVIGVVLGFIVWKSRKKPRPAQWLAWAAVLTWTLMLNIYVPIYDSVLVVLAVILTLGALCDLRWSRAAEWTTFLAVLIFAVSWIAEPVAKAHGIQLLTVVLSLFGSAQLYFLRRMICQNPAETPTPA
jgi:hypothetical protein